MATKRKLSENSVTTLEEDASAAKLKCTTDCDEISVAIDSQTIEEVSQVSQTSQQLSSQDVDEDEDLFDDDVPPLDLNKFHRFKVEDVQDHGLVKHLTLRSVLNKHRYYCLVGGQWTANRLEPNQFVNIKTSICKENTLEVNDLEGLIVINPDHFVSCTTVAGTLFCSRKAWLNEKYRGWVQHGVDCMLIGTLVHELFQQALVEKATNAKHILDLLNVSAW